MTEREAKHRQMRLRVAKGFCLLALTLVFLGGEYEVTAQDRRSLDNSYQVRSSQTLQNKTNRSQVENLPDWAESGASKSGSDDYSDQEGSVEEGVQTRGSPADRPGSEVPVDGGVVWLILAGVGYGVFRLQNTRSSVSLERV